MPQSGNPSKKLRSKIVVICFLDNSNNNPFSTLILRLTLNTDIVDNAIIGVDIIMQLVY